MSDFLSNDFRNFSCCSGGNFSNFTEDTAQTSQWIIAGDINLNTIRVALSDVSGFLLGNIVHLEGKVYLGNFKVKQVLQRNGTIPASVILDTPFLKKSPTAKQDAAYTNGWVDTEPHTVKNLTRFSDNVVNYGKKLTDVRRATSGMFKDASIYYVYPNNPFEPEGLVADTYRKFKKDDQKGTLAKDEVEYLKNLANTACERTSGGTVSKCKSYVSRKYPKLYDGVTLTAGATLNEVGKLEGIGETENESPIAKPNKYNDDGSVKSSSTSGVTKYLFLGVAAIGAFFLIRSIVKKQ